MARGAQWHGHTTDQAVAIFVAAEGNDDIHVRRAATDFAAGATGPLFIAQIRPRLDEVDGLPMLLGLIQSATGGVGGCLDFPEVHDLILYGSDKYLSAEERAERDSREDDGDLGAWDWADGLARPRYKGADEAMARGHEHFASDIPEAIRSRLSKNVFLVIDTYSQTSADDSKAVVSKYIKTLRDLQDKATALGGRITALVIDHTTKAGDSYMGSGAKRGDSDVMLDIERHGDGYGLTVKCAKVKSGAHFAPIHLALAPTAIGGHIDSQGRPLTSLHVVDGEQAHRIRKAVGANSDTAAAQLLGVLDDIGPVTEPCLRQAYLDHPANAQKSADTKARSFRRALTGLREAGAIQEDRGGLLLAVLDGNDE